MVLSCREVSATEGGLVGSIIILQRFLGAKAPLQFKMYSSQYWLNIEIFIDFIATYFRFCFFKVFF